MLFNAINIAVVLVPFTEHSHKYIYTYKKRKNEETNNKGTDDKIIFYVTSGFTHRQYKLPKRSIT